MRKAFIRMFFHVIKTVLQKLVATICQAADDFIWPEVGLLMKILSEIWHRRRRMWVIIIYLMIWSDDLEHEIEHVFFLSSLYRGVLGFCPSIGWKLMTYRIKKNCQKNKRGGGEGQSIPPSPLVIIPLTEDRSYRIYLICLKK